ncbi:MAG: SIMPL domain-containing protein, partial [Thermoanaerobaculia bacterium]
MSEPPGRVIGARGIVAGALLLSAGLAVGGALIGAGLARARAADRYVTVKGISEREVRADTSLWPLRLVAADDDLARANQQLAASVEKLRAFLAGNGIAQGETSLQGVKVTDAFAEQYRPAGQVARRYVVETTLLVRSATPDRVLAVSQKVGELVRQGVVLSTRGDYEGSGPTFLFTRLNDIKPAMIAEATAHAREAATQFARDSRSGLGGIRRATQG